MNAQNGALGWLSEAGVSIGLSFAVLLCFGVFGEYFAGSAKQIPPPLAHWISNASSFLVVMGVWGEVFWSAMTHVVDRELTRRSNKALEEAVAANTKLRKQVSARVVTKEQRDVIASFGPKLGELTVAFVTEAEAELFAISIWGALRSAAVATDMYRLPHPMFGSGTGIMVYDPDGYVNRNGGAPTDGEPLKSLVCQAGLAAGTMVIGTLPDGVGDMRRDIPALIVMAKGVIPPDQPSWLMAHWAEQGKK